MFPCFQILIVNNKACSLLGYSSTELCNLRFCDLLRNKTKAFTLNEHQDSEASEDGTIVLLSGKVCEKIIFEVTFVSEKQTPLCITR